MAYQTLLLIRVREADTVGYGQPVQTVVTPLMPQVKVYSYPQFNRKPVGLLMGAEEVLVYPDSYRDGFIRVYVGTDIGWIHVESVTIEGLTFTVEPTAHGNVWRMRVENAHESRKTNNKPKGKTRSSRE